MSDTLELFEKLKRSEFDWKEFEAMLKKNKNIIHNEELLENSYFIFNAPKNLRLLKNDWTLMDLTFPIYYSYIVTNISNGKTQIKKWKSLATRYVKDEIELWKETDLNVNMKVLYELAKIEEKNKWKIKIHIDPNNLVCVKKEPRWYSKYEAFFERKNGQKDKVKIQADTDNQVIMLASDIIKKKGTKYNNLDFINKVDFWKTIWEDTFVKTEQRKPLSKKELYDLTRQIYKFVRADWNKWIAESIWILIWRSNGNIKSTLIALDTIVKEYWISKPHEIFQQLNNEDLRKWQKPNFDTVYISILEKIDQIGTSETFENLSNLIERQVFLESSLKKALKWPLITLVLITVILLFVMKTMLMPLEWMYEQIWKPLPYFSQQWKNLLEYLSWSILSDTLMQYYTGDSTIMKILFTIFFNNIFAIVFTIYILKQLFNFFITYNFKGKKIFNDVIITIPVIWKFFLNKEYEILLSVAANLYKSESSHSKNLNILKNTVSNYHIKWLFNTAQYYFSNSGIPAYDIFIRYPYYIKPEIASLFKDSNPDETEIWIQQLSIYYENNDFINNLTWLIKSVMFFITLVLMLIALNATIIPLLRATAEI